VEVPVDIARQNRLDVLVDTAQQQQQSIPCEQKMATGKK
jgi:hypothetical protein